MSLPVAVVGAGGFGRALAIASARVGRRVIVYSREKRELDNERIRVTGDLSEIAEAELVFLAVPSPHIPDVAERLGHHLDGRHLVVHVSRGLVGDELQTVSEVVRDLTPVRRVGALAGPLVAATMAKGEPAGGIVGTLFPEVADAVSDALMGPRLRIYRTDDVVGVELAAALGGVVALAMGYALAMNLGPGTLGVLATRGLFEAARIGAGRGASERTFAGLAGVGDLIAAVAGDGRPEVAFGHALAKGKPLEEAANSAGAYVEGAKIAPRVSAWADRTKVSVPLTNAVAKLMAGTTPPAEILRQLMERPQRHE
jgi:glycerol-3-phosphate dehydrogenase (NAD(P)+)